MFISKLCKIFKKNKIPYALVGGYAVVLHGISRGTVDVDIVIQWQEKALRKTVDALTSMGLESRLPLRAEDVFNFRREYVENRNLIAWNFFNPVNPMEQVDIIIDYSLEESCVETMQTRFGEIRVLNRQSLIEMKTAAGRNQDIEDVKALRELSR